MSKHGEKKVSYPNRIINIAAVRLVVAALVVQQNCSFTFPPLSSTDCDVGRPAALFEIRAPVSLTSVTKHVTNFQT